MAAHASGHVASTCRPSRRISGRAQTIGIVVQLLQRRPLRADEAVREHVVAITADALHRFRTIVAGPYGDLQTAPCLAQGAGPVGGADARVSGGHAPIVADAPS